MNIPILELVSGQYHGKKRTMTTITHRERALTALNHQEPDRTPIDFGGASPTRIKRAAYVKLVEHLGLPSEGARG